MPTISETIKQLIDAYREQWDEPNRVRMGINVYRQLYNELAIADGREPIGAGDDTPLAFGKVHGLPILLGVAYSPDDISVDHTDYPGYEVKQATWRLGAANAN